MDIWCSIYFLLKLRALKNPQILGLALCECFSNDMVLYAYLRINMPMLDYLVSGLCLCLLFLRTLRQNLIKIVSGLSQHLVF